MTTYSIDRADFPCLAAVALGEAAAVNPSTYFLEEPLRMYRTSLAWLKAKCRGAVILDPARGGRWLIDVPAAAIAAEDAAHAAELDRTRREAIAMPRIVVPT